jgi:hypothetical protein
MACYGPPVTGHMTPAVATTECRARGSKHPKLVFSGPQVTGVGAAPRSSFMKDIGVRRWGFMAGLITVLATAVLGLKEDVGTVVASLTTLE